MASRVHSDISYKKSNLYVLGPLMGKVIVSIANLVDRLISLIVLCLEKASPVTLHWIYLVFFYSSSAFLAQGSMLLHGTHNS